MHVRYIRKGSAGIEEGVFPGRLLNQFSVIPDDEDLPVSGAVDPTTPPRDAVRKILTSEHYSPWDRLGRRRMVEEDD